MAATVIIPARYASTRFPGKMLASETGRPLVQHVVEQVRKARNVNRIIVAADDDRIASALRPFDTDVRLTSPDHVSGTDRVWEVGSSLAPDTLIVNVQGDEPEIEPRTIDRLIERMESTEGPASRCAMGTCATAFPAGVDPNDPNLVKVVIASDGGALYFSRAPIPFHRDTGTTRAYYLHLGIYAYRWTFLEQFVAFGPGRLESIERLEQLRALENGHAIYVEIVDRATHGIDTPQQYAEFVKRVASC